MSTRRSVWGGVTSRLDVALAVFISGTVAVVLAADPGSGQNRRMRLSAKADYALRAAAELAGAAGEGPVKGERVAAAQEIPPKFLENILIALRHAGLVRSQRGAEGGYWLARPPEEITLADVIRAVEGPLASVRGERPEALSYRGSAEPLGLVWVAVRANLRAVLEAVTLADLAAGELPASVTVLTEDADAWAPH
jgi:Rrf2 family protein